MSKESLDTFNGFMTFVDIVPVFTETILHPLEVQGENCIILNSS